VIGAPVVDDCQVAPPRDPGADDAASARFVRDSHELLRDLLHPDAKRYWVDFLATIAIVYAAFAVYLRARDLSLLQAAASVVCALAMYRAVVFTHEITHRRGGSFDAFTVAWNLLCGIPFLMPSFLYGNHQGHHTNHHYGTWADPEYMRHSRARGLRIVVFLLLPALYPLMAAARFLIGTPLAVAFRPINRLLWTRGSSLYVMNEFYRREIDAASSSRARWCAEVMCAAWVWTVMLLVASHRMSWQPVAKTYLVFVFWIGVNQIRTLVAHRYSNDMAQPVSYLNRWLPELWAPLGMRYHALHHLMPSLPYHAMAEAHRRLVTRLPPRSAYHETLRPGLWPALVSTVLDRPAPVRPRATGR
jgi:fatty acid desaturase